MNKFKEARPIVLGLAVRKGRILASKGYDKIANKTFYRAIGGGIEFLEKSEVALAREFKEELGINITVGKFICVEENIFTLNGTAGHEIIFLYFVIIDDKDFKEVYYEEGDENYPIEWINIQDIKTGKVIFYPSSAVKYL